MFRIPVLSFGIFICGYGFDVKLPLWIDIHKGKNHGTYRYLFKPVIKTCQNILGKSLTY